MRKFLFFLILTFFLSVGTASAWELTFDGHWDDIPQATYTKDTSISIIDFQNDKAAFTTVTNLPSISISQNYTGYLRFTTYAPTANGTIDVYLRDSSGGFVYSINFNPKVLKESYNTIELISSADESTVTIYRDGVSLGTATRQLQTDVTKIMISLSAGDSRGLYIDDISTSPYCIAQNGFFSSSNNLAYFTSTTPLTAGYNYYMQISKDTGASIKQWNLTSRHTQESISPMSELKSDGIYYSEIYGQDGALYYSKPFLFWSNGVYPPIYFIAETDTAAEIRDENNNGGTVTGGGSVYLYPDTKANGYYNFTCEFSEAAYSRSTEFIKVYNTSVIQGSIFQFSGLQSQNYNVSIDNSLIGHTNGADTWSYTGTWQGNNSYIMSFEPDYSLPGVWGYVKSSETQTGLPSASVTISNNSFSTVIRTDINGMYYYTSGIVAGETYTVQASKTGYDKPAASTITTQTGLTTRKDIYLDPSQSAYPSTGSGIYYAPHDVAFTVREYWYSGAGLTGVSYAIYNGTEQIKTGTTDSKGMFTGSDLTGGTNYTIILTHNGTTYTEYVEPSLTEYTFVLNKEGILHKYANPWLTISYTENSQNVTITYESNKIITGASLTAIAGNGTTVYTQTLNTTSGSFLFETGGEGDYTLNFHIQATDGNTASQSWGLSYPNKVPLFPDSYPAWLKNILFSGIVMVFLLAFGKSKNDIACGAVAILASMGYIFEWFTGSFYFLVLVWIIALGAVFLHYKRTGGIG